MHDPSNAPDSTAAATTAAGPGSSDSRASGPFLEVRGLGRDFDRVAAVKDLDLRIEPGEMYGFLGPNGAGKTTTMRLLTGLLRPTRGTIHIDGRTYADDGRHIRAITGYVPDTPPLYEYLTGRQYIGFVASLYGIEPEQRNADAARWLEALDLADRGDDICKSYSHGMRKKLHIAAVLVTRPRLLFLDEPTNGLDPRSARHLKDSLLRVRDEGVTIFLSTHLLETAAELCNRIGILYAGELRAEGTLDELRALGSGDTLEDIFLRLTEGTGSTEAELEPTDDPESPDHAPTDRG